MRILVIHGPNLNMLGKREPEIYGSSTLDDVNARLGKEAKELGAEVEFFQSNSEGEIVGRIQAAMDSADGILINPGGYTHTSVAIRDAILSAGLPVVEAHMSNIYKREDFRQKSYVSGVAMGVISGFGAESYSLGLRGLVDYLKGKAGS
ncbi:MAG: type II 3-dehydroquinate dehydratase [Candidatus Dadabacteria bacterium]|nr:type II 3-dehydroquinate dehydratase [Candidatus Dadabacteria bacterium]